MPRLFEPVTDSSELRPGDLVRLTKDDVALEGSLFGIGPDLRIELHLFSPELSWAEINGFAIQRALKAS